MHVLYIYCWQVQGWKISLYKCDAIHDIAASGQIKSWLKSGVTYHCSLAKSNIVGNTVFWRTIRLIFRSTRCMCIPHTRRLWLLYLLWDLIFPTQKVASGTDTLCQQQKTNGKRPSLVCYLMRIVLVQCDIPHVYVDAVSWQYNIKYHIIFITIHYQSMV